MDRSNPRVLVVGGGIMGCGIAAGLLAHDHDVVLLVRDPARAADIHRKTLALIDFPTAAQAAALSVRAIDGFGDWTGLSLVIETVKEDLALKQQLFAWLDAHVPPEVPVGSNSSSYPISRIAEGLATRSRMYGMH